MTEEEYFRKNYPNSCYGDKPLSPHWDFFQDGVEFGERQSEKLIEELEATNKTISNECHKLVDSLEKKQNEVVELKKESDFYRREKGEYKSAFLQEVRKTIKLNKQLTKTKELLRMIIDSYNHKERFSFEKDLMKSEQFLKEVSE